MTTVGYDDPRMQETRDEAGEHERFDEIFPYFSKAENSIIITDDIINNYLDEAL